MTVYRFALLGDPVAHSLSPAIHRLMLDLAGLSGGYETIRADERMLADTVAELRAGRWNGLNVTMPLKNAAARIADSLSPRAERSQSVNTLLLDATGVFGDSTDSTAFHELFARPAFADCPSVLVLGAGGSAAAALAALDIRPHVYVAARRIEQAEDLAGRLGGEPIAWGTAVAGALVVNATPVGMKGETLPGGILEVASALIDLPYGEGQTPSVGRAIALDIPWVGGEEFLIRQAMASFTLWTGTDVDFERVADGLRKP